jgi:hypothetical protein
VPAGGIEFSGVAVRSTAVTVDPASGYIFGGIADVSFHIVGPVTPLIGRSRLRKQKAFVIRE